MPTFKLSDGMVMRAVFFALLGFTAVILYRDFQAMRAENAGVGPSPILDQPILPALPRTVPSSDTGADEDSGGDVRSAPDIVTDADVLRLPLSLELISDGVLRVTGTIEPGSAARFVTETAEQVEYIKIVELDSPGGSVTDALTISEAVREAGWQTRVRSGALCASSCPLIFSGGTERIAGADAAIGVHQMFTTQNDERTKAESISGTQSLTARITRHLVAMGVEAQLWVHAMETPPQYLYYLTPDEMADFQLATSVSDEI
ncbi:MAG: hypothetical protein AAF141_10405 [Pseudomonadota bacterium]